MKRFVIDTNCLLQILPKRSPYNYIWRDYLEGKFILCVTTEILNEYEEILANNASAIVADNIVSLIVAKNNTVFVTPYYCFGLITADVDDNKFVDCAICAGASFIVTEDRHFDVLLSIDYPKVNIINLEQYHTVMRDTSKYLE